LKQQELEKTLAAVERILLLFPDLTLELRDRGLISYQLGYYPQAIDDFQKYLAKVPDADDASVIRRLLTELDKNG
ncbi:MAG: tetratricopeptide repeat protein, partial [Nostoc sp. C3-bin3]|nr:tetratricopeptide repeat protein [Nostoc sp. C3-bin3]